MVITSLNYLCARSLDVSTLSYASNICEKILKYSIFEVFIKKIFKYSIFDICSKNSSSLIPICVKYIIKLGGNLWH